jgi:hypothetical protein
MEDLSLILNNVKELFTLLTDAYTAVYDSKKCFNKTILQFSPKVDSEYGIQYVNSDLIKHCSSYSLCPRVYNYRTLKIDNPLEKDRNQVLGLYICTS